MSTIVPPSTPGISLDQMVDRDILTELLADKRSPQTRHAYEKDVRDFFMTMTGRCLTPELVAEFLGLDRFDAVALVLRYKAQMISKGLKSATINRRLAAIKSLVKFARFMGKCSYTLEDVQGENVQKYRDTTGISRDSYREVLSIPNRETLKGKRDYALLRLLWDNALRRGEIALTNIKDFDPESRTLQISGKGRGTLKEAICLTLPTTEALLSWLKARRELNPDAPMFISLDPVNPGHRLTGSAIYWIVQQACKASGVSKQMSPHRIRHSSITAALDATDGNVRKVQKLSRHANLNTLMIYDDNRQQHQLEISELLADMV